MAKNIYCQIFAKLNGEKVYQSQPIHLFGVRQEKLVTGMTRICDPSVDHVYLV